MRRALAAVAVVLLAGCTGGQPAVAPSSEPPLVSPAASAPPLQQVHDPGKVTGTLTGRCHYRDAAPDELPDPRCTPGAYDPSVTAAVLCARDAKGRFTYSTKAYRPPDLGLHGTARFKFGQAYPAYGIPASALTELDHLVSLELGGANSASNLWPESPPSPNPKDTVENRLHAWVCSAPDVGAAQDRLESAQQAVAADWVTALQVLRVGGT